MVCGRMSRGPQNAEGKVLTVGLGRVGWANSGDMLLAEGMYKLFLPAQVVVYQMDEIRE